MIQCASIGAVGAEVDGVDLNIVSDDDLEKLKALLQKMVCYFLEIRSSLQRLI